MRYQTMHWTSSPPFREFLFCAALSTSRHSLARSSFNMTNIKCGEKQKRNTRIRGKMQCVCSSESRQTSEGKETTAREREGKRRRKWSIAALIIFESIHSISFLSVSRMAFGYHRCRVSFDAIVSRARHRWRTECTLLPHICGALFSFHRDSKWLAAAAPQNARPNNEVTHFMCNSISRPERISAEPATRDNEMFDFIIIADSLTLAGSIEPRNCELKFFHFAPPVRAIIIIFPFIFLFSFHQ